MANKVDHFSWESLPSDIIQLISRDVDHAKTFAFCSLVCTYWADHFNNRLDKWRFFCDQLGVSLVEDDIGNSFVDCAPITVLKDRMRIKTKIISNMEKFKCRVALVQESANPRETFWVHKPQFGSSGALLSTYAIESDESKILDCKYLDLCALDAPTLSGPSELIGRYDYVQNSTYVLGDGYTILDTELLPEDVLHWPNLAVYHLASGENWSIDVSSYLQGDTRHVSKFCNADAKTPFVALLLESETEGDMRLRFSTRRGRGGAPRYGSYPPRFSATKSASDWGFLILLTALA